MRVLESAPALRDLGGLPLPGGARVRSGRVYRAGGLASVTEADRGAIAALGIGTVIDLRSDVERHHNPSLWGEVCGARVAVFDVNRDVRAGGSELLQVLRSLPGEVGADRMMLHTYRHFGKAFEGRIGEMFAALLEGDGAVLIHCTAGKDRTGFACAMVLQALGAAPEVVMADYCRSAEHRYGEATYRATAQMLAAYMGQEPAPEVVATVMGVRPEYLAAALAGLGEDFGSAHAYLTEVAGLDADRRQRLTVRLTEAATAL